MRRAPADVPPVDLSGIRFSAPHFGYPQRGGTLEARDAKTNSLLWSLKIYTTKYDRSIEEDVQDVFIRRLEVREQTLVIIDERGREFHLDPRSRRIVEKPTVSARIQELVEQSQFQEAADLLDEFNPPDWFWESRIAVYRGAERWPEVVGLTSALIELGGGREAYESLMEDYRDRARELSGGKPPIPPPLEAARQVLSSLPSKQRESLRSHMKAAYRALKTEAGTPPSVPDASGRPLTRETGNREAQSHMEKVLTALRQVQDRDAFLASAVDLGECTCMDLTEAMTGYSLVRARGRRWLATLAVLF